MPVGLSDGTSFADHGDWLATSVDKSDKRRQDSIEMAENQRSGDFQSRFYATDTSTMPPEASEKLAGALKASRSTEVPARGVIDKLTGRDDGERYQTWPEKAVRGAFDALAAPGEAYAGKLPMWAADPVTGEVHTSHQAVEKAAELATLAVTGPAPVASKLADGTLGSFAGVKSKTLPRDKLYEAQNMELDMVHPDTIWDKTGFFRGADNRWRYEIPDIDAKLNPESFTINKEIIQNPSGWSNVANHGEVVETWLPKTYKSEPTSFGNIKQWLESGADLKQSMTPPKPLTLDKVLDHPELFKAYPELKTMKVEPLPEYLKGTKVEGQVVGDTIYLKEAHPERVRSVLLHEIQHGIQHHEGFAYGGNPSQFLPRELPQAEKEFLQIKQEIEPEIAKATKDTGLSVDQWKNAVKAEKDNELYGGGIALTYEERLRVLKKDYPREYKRLSKIVESERLIEHAKEEAFQKYQRLMGEVEARNVQARMNYNAIDRSALPPYRTEDISRIHQINPE